MELTINGQTRSSSALTIDILLKELNLLPSQVAVEHNGTVLFRQNFATTKIAEGDRIEVIRAVAGG